MTQYISDPPPGKQNFIHSDLDFDHKINRVLKTSVMNISTNFHQNLLESFEVHVCSGNHIFGHLIHSDLDLWLLSLNPIGSWWLAWRTFVPTHVKIYWKPFELSFRYHIFDHKAYSKLDWCSDITICRAALVHVGRS